MKTLEKKQIVSRRQPRTVNPISNQRSGLNKAQITLLQSLRNINTVEEALELKEIISNYYIEKLQKEADRLWDEGVLGDFLLKEHLRTPYK
jgi:hypothetical protein